ncbi:MAG: leucine-rich repeat protein, partial [bacterium]|nr:leucine-rich repeat protein [bacterium]
MSDKKFKLSKKNCIYAAAGAVLAGTFAAAAITAPSLLKSAFNPDKYSFDDTRSNGDVAYNTSSSSQGSSSDDGNDDETSAAGKPNDSKKADEDISDTDSSKQEDEQKPEGEQNKAPEEAERNQEYNNNGSSEEVSEKAGTDKGGYTLVNTGSTTNVAASRDSLAEYRGNASDNLVDMTDKEGVIVSSPEFTTPAPAVTPKPPEFSKEPETNTSTAPQTTKKPSATNRPQQTVRQTARPMAPSPTRIPTSGGGGGTHTSKPSESSKPQISDTPSATEVPSATEKPEPTAEVTAQPSKEPMPTPEPDVKPQDAIKENENNGNEVEVSKGGIGITNHHGGSGSISSGGATRIDFTKFTGDQSSVEYIQVSSTITSINFETDKLLFPNLKGYVVNENNKKYMSIDGVLYSKDGKTLYACPAKLDSITEYPESLETIYDGAFIGSQMNDIELPETVKAVGKKAFAEAAIGSLTLNSENVTLGGEVFYNGNENGLSVKKLVFKSLTPPEVESNDALKFKDPNTGLDKSGMVIEVPDSDNDKVYQDYVKAWGETIDGIYGSGMTSYLINTGTNAGRNYSFENNALYQRVNPIKAEETPEETANPEETAKPETPEETTAPDTEENKDGLILLYVAPSTKGAFTPRFNTEVIGEGAFEGCSEITSVNLPATVTELQDGCFKGLDKLTSIVVAGTVPAKVGENVWKDIDPDEVSIYVYPNSVQDYLDKWGTVINKALGEGSAEKIIKGASENYTYIDGALYAVSGDEKILVDAPHTNLDNFRIDSGTVEIAAGAFGSKYTYNYVVIPNSVNKINENAFTNTKIKILVMTAEEPPELPEGLDTSGIDEVYVPSGSLDKYKNAWGERFTSIEAPAVNYASEGHAVYGINEDGTYILFNLPIVASGSFTMLDTVKEIRERAMAECADIEEINFSVMIEKLGREAFINNTSLKSVDISRLTELKELSERAFYGNTSMTGMQLPVLAEVIGDEFAAENTSLETVNFDKLTKLTSIGKKAFYNDKSLKEVSLSSSRNLTQIGESAFENCESVTVARMPLNLEVMCSKLFKNASSLGRISFSSNLKEIGDEALYGTALKSLNFTYNEELKKIGEGAFANNTVMTSLQLPKNVTSVSARLAENNTSLETVVLSDKTEEIGDRAFAGCKELFEIDIPKTIKKIGEKVFEGCNKLAKIIIRAIEPAELGDEVFGTERDNLSIYVPDASYDEYISAWDKTLFNRADQIIKKLSLIEDEDTDETPEPTDNPITTPEPPSKPTMPPINPSIGPTVSPEGTSNPEATSSPEETSNPET